jgi:hypothetical protein
LKAQLGDRLHLLGPMPDATILDNTAEKSLVASNLDDVRQTPLGQLPSTETLRRVRPADSKRVPVAAFNASL